MWNVLNSLNCVDRLLSLGKLYVIVEGRFLSNFWKNKNLRRHNNNSTSFCYRNQFQNRPRFEFKINKLLSIGELHTCHCNVETKSLCSKLIPAWKLCIFTTHGSITTFLLEINILFVFMCCLTSCCNFTNVVNWEFVSLTKKHIKIIKTSAIVQEMRYAWVNWTIHVEIHVRVRFY